MLEKFNCSSFWKQVADPEFLKVSPLSPDFLQRQVFLDQGKSHFGFFFPVSELDIIWVGGEITGGKVEKSSRWTLLLTENSNIFWKSRFWVWGGHLWENRLCWGRTLDPGGLLVSGIPLEGLRLPKVQVRTLFKKTVLGNSIFHSLVSSKYSSDVFLTFYPFLIGALALDMLEHNDVKMKIFVDQQHHHNHQRLTRYLKECLFCYWIFANSVWKESSRILSL